MKSDEEFLAGIYQKAEQIQKAAASEENNTEKNKVLRFRLRTWQGLAAAACVCLLIGLAFQGRNWSGDGNANGVNENYGDQPQVAAYAFGELTPEPDEAAQTRIRSVDTMLPVTGTVRLVTDEGETSVISFETQEDSQLLTIRVLCDVQLQAGEKLALMLTVSEEEYELLEETAIYRAAEDGLYYNTDGTVFSQTAGGK